MNKKTDSAQLDTWRGEFGDSYADRNAVTPERIRIYTRIYATIWKTLEYDPPKSVLECGCNVGLVLRALGNITDAKLNAIEPNAKARAIAQQAGDVNIVEGSLQGIPFEDRSVELAFTSGVLIHVAPADLDKAFDELARVSSKYVLMIEYFSKNLVEIDYRGHDGLLWKADYGKLFMERHPEWQPIDAGFFWDVTTGFDDSNWWLFRRKD